MNRRYLLAAAPQVAIVLAVACTGDSGGPPASDPIQLIPFEYGRLFARGIPHAEFHEIDGAGHGIVANAEAEAILRDWVSEVRTP